MENSVFSFEFEFEVLSLKFSNNSSNIQTIICANMYKYMYTITNHISYLLKYTGTGRHKQTHINTHATCSAS